MENTLSPELIYEVFARNGFPVLRIDNFDRGDYAELRTELKYNDNLSIDDLQEMVLRLRLIEENENIKIKIIHIDMIHKSLRLNIYINETEQQ
jgi:hypothetical protein